MPAFQTTVVKLFEQRKKFEADLKTNHAAIDEALQKLDRRVKIEKLIDNSKELLEKAVSKNSELLELANKTSHSDPLTRELEQWVADITSSNDVYLDRARSYIDTRNDKPDDTVSKKSRTSKHESHKSASERHSNCSGSGVNTASLTSTQRKKRLLAAKLRREEIERQSSATLAIAQQKQEALMRQKQAELTIQQELDQLALEELAENNRQRLEEAKIQEVELEDDVSEEDVGLDEKSQPSNFPLGEGNRIRDWVNDTTENQAAPFTEPPSAAIDSFQIPCFNADLQQPFENLNVGTSFGEPNAETSLPTPGVNFSQPNSVETVAPTTFPITCFHENLASSGLNQTNPIIVKPTPSCLPVTTVPQSTNYFPQSRFYNPNLSYWVHSCQSTTAPAVDLNQHFVGTTHYGYNPENFGTINEPSSTISNPYYGEGNMYYNNNNSNPNLFSSATHVVPQPCYRPQDMTYQACNTPQYGIYNNSAANKNQPITVKDLAEIFQSNQKNPLPEWKLSRFDGDPLQWHEWYGQFKSSVDSSALSDDIKLTYLKTLVTGKAKAAIAEFAYCGVMYKDALRTLEKKFGQPQTVVSAHLEKLSNFPHLKMHNSECIINYSSAISSLIGVFKSLSYEADLKSTSLLNQAVSKLPPNLKESWSLHSVKRHIRPTLLSFNDWLKDKAEAHELMRSTSFPKNKSESTSKLVPTSKVFSSNTKTESNVQNYPLCVVCKGKHPLWRCAVFKEKTPTQRAKLVAEHRLCFSCLNGKHVFRECPKPRQCTNQDCTSSHNVLLHGAERVYPQRQLNTKVQTTKINKTVSGASSKDPKNSSSTCASSITDIKGLLQIISVKVLSDHNKVSTLALCDSACSHSWISSRLANRLKVTGNPVEITVNGINSNQLIVTQQVRIEISSDDENNNFSFEVRPYVKENMNIGNDSIDVPALQEKYPHLLPIKSIKYNYSEVDIILGQDVFHAIRPLEYFESKQRNTPIAVCLPIGWVLSGPLPSCTGLVSTCFKANIEDSPLADFVKSWYEMESFGTYIQTDPRSFADKRALKILESTTINDGERYSVGMLWAEDNIKLPNNYYSSLVQLKSLEKRLDKDPHLKEQYSKTIKDDLEQGYIVEVDSFDLRKKVDREWYLPHHPVLNPNKPGKVRRVLNGASKFHGSSLNNALLKGPDLLQSLLHVLLRFRQYPYAVSADIEGMFLQVGVLPVDQPSLRFLWREDPTSDVVVYQYTRHIFGAKDSPTCANFALKSTAKDNSEQYPQAAAAVKNNFYMDDYLDSSETPEQALSISQNLVKLLKLGGFNLTKFVSNVSGLAEQLNPSKVIPSTAVKDILKKSDGSSHVLGLKWNHQIDTLNVSRGLNRDFSRPETQRVVLSVVSAVFDPIGVVAPFTVRARLLLKDIWRLNGQKWDDPLPENLSQQFLDWCSELPGIEFLTIPRSYFNTAVTDIELHIFGDSSQEVFCAVAFLRAKSIETNETLLAFLFGKARVAPMKTLSIPKLELQAALLAARLQLNILQALTIEVKRTYMWTDSTTVLQWLSSIDKQPVFIANRVAEILESTTVDQWNHVSTKDNPADAGTRGLSVEALKESSWLNGPAFLRTIDWPFKPNTNVVDTIKLPQNIDTHTVNETTCNSNLVSSGIKSGQTIFWSKYSSYQKLLRVIAYASRLLAANAIYRLNINLQPPELVAAQKKLLFLIQSESFFEEKKQLLSGKHVLKTSRICVYSPFIDSAGLLRSTGRIKHLVEVEFDTKHPIILDSRHPMVRLFLIHLHEKHQHQGVDYLRAVVQQNYAVIRLRATLRNIQLNCVKCRKFKSQPSTPMMADLPKERLAYQSPPFTNTGVDYFGPFYVSIRRCTVKRWGFLFTCLTTRAVHFEIVHSMDTCSCMMGIERFISRRGIPSVIWSDNGTNFVGAEKELLSCMKNLDQSKITSTLSNKGIRWKFNPPYAPHHGGSWERLVRSFKKTFYLILGNRRLTDEVLLTTFCLVEQTLNARPLTTVSSDPNDLDAITPNHFLLGRSSISLPTASKIDFNHRKRYLRSQAYAEAIWSRWLKDYVPSLNKRTKWQCPSERELRTGDLVWIVEDDSPKGYYPLARVKSLHFGKDGIPRSAELKTASGIYTRPVVKLVQVLGPPSSGPEDVAAAI